MSASLSCLCEHIQIPGPVFSVENKPVQTVLGGTVRTLSLSSRPLLLNTSPSDSPLVQVVFLANPLIYEMKMFYSL